MIFCIEKKTVDEKFQGFGSLVSNPEVKSQLKWDHKPYVMLHLNHLISINHDNNVPGNFRVIAGLFAQYLSQRGFQFLLIQDESSTPVPMTPVSESQQQIN